MVDLYVHDEIIKEKKNLWLTEIEGYLSFGKKRIKKTLSLVLLDWKN